MSNAKKELEEFAYIVSHDLNAPLRHIRSFSNLLIKSMGDKVSDDEREYVRFIENGVIKLEDMLAALLHYSRVNTKTEAFTALACEDVLNTVIAGLDADIKSSGATITLGHLPPAINGDKTQIQMLFHHLIDNALKFRSADTPPVIDISAVEKDGAWLFSITDNGIGIPVEQHENVFKIFKRLNPDNGLSGIGAGLTIAKAIAERHNGQIRIDPDYTDGCRVCVDLPCV
ncbi:MAG: sensor histidine kinase [Bdellovibrionales bacterium]